MFDTAADIEARIRAGEDSFVEFKELRLGKRSVVSPNAESVAGEMVAFANAEGGALLLGVKDDGTVDGIAEDALGTVEEWVVNVASNRCDPPIRPVVRRILLPDAGGDLAVLAVEIKQSLYVHATATGRWLVRVGSSKRRLTGQELPRLFQQRGRAFVFDEQPVMTASGDALDRKALERFFSGPLGIPWEELLRKTRVLLRDEQGVDRPTVAAMLAFAEAPEEHLLSAKIEAGVYRRDLLDSADLVHSQTFTGPVARQIDEAVSFVDRFMLRPATKSAEGRLDYPQYAIEAVREAVVNAVAHRDYSLGGAKIRLFLFSDRLELYSPGALPNTLTLEDMPYRVFTRNQLLVNFLSRTYSEKTGRVYLESRGEGVRRILEESERHSGRRPEYRLLGQELLLTIWAQSSPHDRSRRK